MGLRFVFAFCKWKERPYLYCLMSDSDEICVFPLQLIVQGNKRDFFQPTWFVFCQQAKHSKLVGGVRLEEVLMEESTDAIVGFDRCRVTKIGRQTCLSTVPWWWCSSLKIWTFSPHCLSGASGLKQDNMLNMMRKVLERIPSVKTFVSKWIMGCREVTYQNGESSWPTVGTGGRLRSEQSHSRGEERPGRYLQSGYPAVFRTPS